MITSMTGYGSAVAENDNYIVNCEIKTLNSKYLDLQYRLPKTLNEKELPIRTQISNSLVRGKVYLQIEIDYKTAESVPSGYNKVLFKKYYDELKELADYVGDTNGDYFRIALQQPEVSISSNEKIPESLWQLVTKVLGESLEKCSRFRKTEGDELEKVLTENIKSIGENRLEIKNQEKKRIDKVRERILNNFKSFDKEELAADPNRLEQELIFYLEKLDIAEELDRLNSHLNHYFDIIKEPEYSGKKLGFLAQEIGREINTIGSKANDADIQKVVVSMKEDLEKIKEQALNIL